MINLPDAAAVRAALCQPLEPQLHELIAKRFAHAAALQLADLTHMFVIQIGDDKSAIIEAIGFDPALAVPDWSAEHRGYRERIFCVGDSGFAFLVFFEEA